MNREWPTREEWAISHRAAYWDSENPHPYEPSNKLSDYATPAEIEAAITALKALWADYGRQMKSAEHPFQFREKRKSINDAIKDLRDGGFPRGGGWMSARSMCELAPALDLIVARYDAAEQAGNERYIAECAAKPVDDAAWAKELERRAMIEQWRANRYGLGSKVSP